MAWNSVQMFCSVPVVSFKLKAQWLWVAQDVSNADATLTCICVRLEGWSMVEDDDPTTYLLHTWPWEGMKVLKAAPHVEALMQSIQQPPLYLKADVCLCQCSQPSIKHSEYIPLVPKEHIKRRVFLSNTFRYPSHHDEFRPCHTLSGYFQLYQTVVA